MSRWDAHWAEPALSQRDAHLTGPALGPARRALGPSETRIGPARPVLDRRDAYGTGKAGIEAAKRLSLTWNMLRRNILGRNPQAKSSRRSIHQRHRPVECPAEQAGAGGSFASPSLSPSSFRWLCYFRRPMETSQRCGTLAATRDAFLEKARKSHARRTRPCRSSGTRPPPDISARCHRRSKFMMLA